MTTPIAIELLRSALDPDSFAEHQVTEWDAELLGITYSNPEAKPRFFAWMMARGWAPKREASGNILWENEIQAIWLSDMVEYAAAYIVRCSRGDEDVEVGDAIEPVDRRPGLEILAEIAATEVTIESESKADTWDGGGMLIGIS